MAYYPFATELGAVYTLSNPNGAVAVFNDSQNPSYAGMLTEITGLDSPEIRESAEELIEADGGVHGYFYAGRRPIIMSGKQVGHGSLVERNLRMDRAKRASLALRNDSTLTWVPSKRREQNITNPRAFTATTGWLTTGPAGLTAGGTLSRQTGLTPSVGTTGFQVITTTTTNQGAAFPFTAIAGKTYYVKVDARRTAGTGTPQAYISGAGIDASLGNLNTTGTFAINSFSFTAITSGTAYLVFRDPSAIATTYQFSDVLLSNADGGYFDGDTAGFYWHGNAHASTAGDYIPMFTYVRRNQPFRESGAWAKEFQIPMVSEYAQVFGTNQKTASGAGGATVATENQGSYPAYPILRITGTSGSNPSITNSTTGALVATTGTLIVASGETLEIDTLSHTAYFTAGARNGQSANRYINFAASTWPALVTGTNNYVLSGTGTLQVLWRDTWM